jgi:hypothetical protein
VALTGLAQVALDLEGPEAAREPLRQALQLALEIGSTPLLLAALVAAVPALPSPHLAGEILARAQGHPALTKETRRGIAELRERGLTPGESPEPREIEELALEVLEVARAAPGGDGALREAELPVGAGSGG